MEFSLHPIRNMQEPWITAVARLHRESMGLLLSDMGWPFVHRYFQLAARDPSVVGFYAASEADEVLGYVVGTPRPDRLNAGLAHPLPWFAGQCLRLLFTNPRALWQAAISSRAQLDEMPEQRGAIELVYVAVSASGRGQGLGRALMQAFADASRQAGHRRILASQEVENEASLRLFSSMGYQVKRKYREGPYERQRVELSLQPE